jgi:hypothetical protein
LDYLDEVGKSQTRRQIEVGAGYMREDERLPRDEYENLKRMIQRDIKELIEQGILIVQTKLNEKHVRGQNDDVILYWFAPDQEIAPPAPSGLLVPQVAPTPPPTVAHDIVAQQLGDKVCVSYSIPEEVKKLLTLSLGSTSKDELVKYLTDILSHLCRTIDG